jgi:hypothetical protein
MRKASFECIWITGLLVVFLISPQFGCAQSATSSVSSQDAVTVMRKVKGQVLISSQNPAIRIEFDKGFKYVGSQSFILYDVAAAEQHFFVDADDQGRVQRLYWVQFEGYLPNNTHSYDYQSKKVVRLAGLDFVADAFPRNIKANPGRADSDGSRARTFLESNGYRLASDDILSQRLVHLVDEAKRNELMIIYIEDLGHTGLTAADLSAGGRAAGRWDETAKGLLERTLANMKAAR